MTAAIEVFGVGKEYFRGVHHTHTRLLSGSHLAMGQEAARQGNG